MKRLAATFATTLLAATAAATDIYQGFGEGNADLAIRPSDGLGTGVTAVQPGMGDRVNRYHGLADGNSDLSLSFEAELTNHEPPEIYGVVSDNPDL